MKMTEMFATPHYIDCLHEALLIINHLGLVIGDVSSISFMMVVY